MTSRAKNGDFRQGNVKALTLVLHRSLRSLTNLPDTLDTRLRVEVEMPQKDGRARTQVAQRFPATLDFTNQGSAHQSFPGLLSLLMNDATPFASFPLVFIRRELKWGSCCRAWAQEQSESIYTESRAKKKKRGRKRQEAQRERRKMGGRTLNFNPPFSYVCCRLYQKPCLSLCTWIFLDFSLLLHQFSSLTPEPHCSHHFSTVICFHF